MWARCQSALQYLNPGHGEAGQLFLLLCLMMMRYYRHNILLASICLSKIVHLHIGIHQFLSHIIKEVPASVSKRALKKR